MSAGRLEARAVRVHFQGLKAIDGVDVAVEQGEVLGLIGPNGAGKTIFGLVAVAEGEISTSGSGAFLSTAAASRIRPASSSSPRRFRSIRASEVAA